MATADTLWNTTLIAQNTTLYRRIATNHACRDTAEILIRVFEGPPASGLQAGGPAGPVCAGDSILLSASISSGTGQGHFFWEGSDGSSQAGASVAFGPAEPVAYTLTYASEGGCDTLATSLAIDVQPGLAVSLEASFPGFANTQQGSSIILDALTNQPPPLDFTWTLNQAVIQQGADLFNYEDVLIADPSVYTVFAQHPESGCRDSTSLVFNVAPPIVEVPNAFTPNGDGVNDFFTYVIAGNVRQVLELKVFNRWGQLVYDGDSANPADFKGWDGTFKGQPQPSEVYFYLIRLERYDGVVEVRRGEVGLLR
ncbi:MAG: gliding motility-associated C-terminal domain-containing protein [Lewinellaceae bacterium]|nr:gliding motility-associated C-terminal domain-containing protein [Lewinellaceae bacterium]